MRLHRCLLAAVLAAGTFVARADSLQEAESAVARKDYAAARLLLEPLAEAGNARAQTELGTLYYHGLGVTESDGQALAWYGRAARQGHAPAQYLLANLYAFGHAAVEPETDRMRLAAQWYFEAARQGHADAQYALGVLFLTGSGVLPNPGEARRWLTRAARQGHADARAYLRATPP